MIVFCFQYYSNLKNGSKYIQVSIGIGFQVSDFFGVNVLLLPVNYDCKPFDAPGWEISAVGLLGPEGEVAQFQHCIKNAKQLIPRCKRGIEETERFLI